ncbi:MAG TPA: Mur ligase domain-containing protein [Solirubrobacteraceae bacterium]|nr:Mur ligase domain-containing protein [Solirubrobacteraceae bacterium]
MSGPWSGRRLHFVGVGGAGMSGYARAARALGAEVTGSDCADSPYLERLRADGVLEASIGHDAANVPTGEGVEVVYSSAVPPENPERVAARARAAAGERGVRDRPRAQLLGELTALKRTIAVAGTHGKTTTSAMLVHVLRASGEQPSWLIGGTPGEGLRNAHWGEGDLLVVEADESDRSMLELVVEIAVLTNVELDHHATFGSLGELRDAFREFLAGVSAGVVVWDRPELVELAREALHLDGSESSAPEAPGEAKEAARSPAGDSQAEAREAARSSAGDSQAGGPGTDPLQVVPYDVPNPQLVGGGSAFTWHGRDVHLSVPGAHNAINAAGALEAALLAGADPRRAIAGIEGFRGAGRRFQLLGETVRGATVYDDYAHHPTEVAATLSAARTLAHRRLVAVFQPHLYSRTALLAREFGVALAQADVVVVLDVYPARERVAEYPGISGLLIAEAAADAARGRPVYWLPTFAGAEPVLRGLLDEGDVCLVMGAGDVDGLGGRLIGGEGEGASTSPDAPTRGTEAPRPPRLGPQPTRADDPQ